MFRDGGMVHTSLHTLFVIDQAFGKRFSQQQMTGYRGVGASPQVSEGGRDGVGTHTTDPSPWSRSLPLPFPQIRDVPLRASPTQRVAAWHTSSGVTKQIVELADSLGKLMQYNSAGFLHNYRQHRQFGLAVIEMTQVCMCVCGRQREIVQEC